MRESGATTETADTITDFLRGTDILDLSGIDASTTAAGNQAFSFIGGRAFSATDANGQLRFANGVLYGSTDADADAEFAIVLTGVTGLVAADLVL